MNESDAETESLADDGRETEMATRHRRERRVTMREVAKLANVSVGTVSRVINKKSSVQAEIKSRVQKAMDSLGYVPDAVAQSMRSQATMAVGCMVSNVSNPLFASAVSAAEQVFHRSGYTMILTNSQDSAIREKEILSLFSRRRLDGLICTVSNESDRELTSRLQSPDMPVVLLERVVDCPVDSVSTDHHGGALQAFNYLHALGHRRIGLITVTEAALPGRDRVKAYREVHRMAGIPYDPTLVATHGFSAEYGYRTGYEMLTSENPPTALVAGANQMVGVLKAVRVLGLQIPRDLSLISFGDTDLAELFTPPLTVVRWGTHQVGATAAEILISRLTRTARKGPLKLVLPAELMLRGSCGPAPK
ncbi:MAG: LacI family DNA-binding transcriptional regulator [Flavobacteriaceae bacterium]